MFFKWLVWQLEAANDEYVEITHYQPPPVRDDPYYQDNQYYYNYSGFGYEPRPALGWGQ